MSSFAGETLPTADEREAGVGGTALTSEAAGEEEGVVSFAEDGEPSVARGDDEVSATAKELIAVRDWVALAKAEKSETDAGVLKSLYERLGQVLELEGVSSLESDGPFDPERQRALGTEATDDAALNRRVCRTVRAGYLFRGRLLRPQEVVVYTSK